MSAAKNYKVDFNDPTIMQYVNEIKDGNSENLETLVDMLGALKGAASKKYNGMLDKDDIDSSFGITVWKCANDFDAAKKIKFTTYVQKMFVYELLSNINCGGQIKVPAELKETALKVHKIENEFFSQYGYEPSTEEILNILQDPGKDTFDIIEAQQAYDEMKGIKSLDDTGREEDGRSLGDITPAPVHPKKSDIDYEEDIKPYIRHAGLTKRQEDILFEIFENGKTGHYLAKNVYHVTDSAINDDKRHALRKIKTAKKDIEAKENRR